MKLNISLIMGVVIMVSCNSKVNQTISLKPDILNESDFVIWVSDNRDQLFREREMGDVNIKIHYMPDAKNKNEIFNFLMNVSLQNNESVFSQYNSKYSSNDQKMMFWSSGIRKYFRLVTDKDTIPCHISVYENTGNIRNDINVLIGFSGKNIKRSKYTLVYDDAYFDLGRLNFSFDEIINNIPETADIN